MIFFVFPAVGAQISKGARLTLGVVDGAWIGPSILISLRSSARLSPGALDH